MSTSGEGWFADPQDAQRLRWWDGSAWTEHTHPLPDHRPPLARWWSGLAIALQVGVGLSMLSALFTLYVDQEMLALVDDVRLRPDTVTEADGARVDRLAVLSLVGVLPFLATGVMFLVWNHTAHNSARMDRSAMRHATGWVVGGWFVPFLNFWRPFQMVTDVRRGATGADDPPVSRRQGWWWGTFLAAYLTSAVARVRFGSLAELSPDVDGERFLDAFASGASWDRTSSVLTVLCGVLAIAVVREITALVLSEPAPDRVG